MHWRLRPSGSCLEHKHKGGYVVGVSVCQRGLVDGILILLMRRSPRASPSARRRLTVGGRRAPRASATPRQARRDCPGLHTQYSGPTSHHIVRMSQVRRRVSRGSQSTGQQTRESAGSECNQSTNSAQLSSNRSAARVSVAAIPKCGCSLTACPTDSHNSITSPRK